MSNPVDRIGNRLNVGDSVIYVVSGYTTLEQEVITKINDKTVNLGDKSQWGSYTRRPFNSVLNLSAIEELVKRSDKLAALEAGGVDNWEGYGWCFEGEEDEDDE